MPSVSVTICTRNGAPRLPATLACLLAQEEPGVPWEVVLVDNGSTDGTADLARSLWPPGHPVPLRVFREERPGISHARVTAFRHVSHPVAVLVDDDNRLCRDYVARAARRMEESPGCALAGGPSALVLQGNPPPWFAEYSSLYAVGEKGDALKSLACHRSLHWGAGLVVRTAFLRALRDRGWSPVAESRRPGSLSGGEDTEMCFAAILSGWDILYDPALRIGHAIDPSRLTWDYLRRMVRDSAREAVLLDPYRFAMRGEGFLARLSRTWAVQLLQALWKALDPSCQFPALLHLAMGREGSAAVVGRERRLGRLRGLWRHRSRYAARAASVRNAPWRRR